MGENEMWGGALTDDDVEVPHDEIQRIGALFRRMDQRRKRTT